MKCLLSCFLLLSIGESQPVRHDEPIPVAEGGSLMQQPSEGASIDSVLAALKQGSASQNRLSQQLAHAIMGLTDRDHRPPWPLVIIFADNLTRELLGKHLTNAQNTALRECLSEAVRRTGTSNARLASRLQEILATGGLTSSKTQIIISDFIKLREFVQGPDDLPVRDVPVRH